MLEENNFSPQQESPASSYPQNREENHNRAIKWFGFVIVAVVLGIVVTLITYAVRTRSASVAPTASAQPSASVSATPSAPKRVDCGIYKADDCSIVKVSTATLWQSVQDPEWTLDCTVKGKAKYVERQGAEPVFNLCDCKCEKSEKKE